MASASWRRRVSVGELASASWLYLSIHIAESFETFAPVTVVQAVNVTGEYTNIYIGHISETHYVSTVEKRKCRVPNNKTCDQSIVEKKIDKHEKRRADRSYMKEYIRKRRANADFRKRENQHSVQRYNNTETIREKKNQTVTERKMTNPERVREIDKRSKRKRKAENPDHIKEIAKKSSRRQKVENSEQVREIDRNSFRKRKEKNPEHRKEVDKQSFRKRKAKNPEHIKEADTQSFRKRKAKTPEHRKEVDKQSFRKQKAKNPEHGKEGDKQSFRKRKADNPEHSEQVNRNSKVRRITKFKLANYLNMAILANENQFENAQKSSHVSTNNDQLYKQERMKAVVFL